MSKSAKVRFVAHAFDEKGMGALRILKEAGCHTAELRDSETALPADVVFLSLDGIVEEGKCLRVSTFDLENKSEWACGNLFLVVVCNTEGRDFQEAVLEAARMYESWFCVGFKGIPWGQAPGNKDKLEAFRRWQGEVENAVQILRDLNFQKTMGLRKKGKSGRRISWNGTPQETGAWSM